MDTSEVIEPAPQNQLQPQQARQSLPIDELRRLTDFFSVLIEIDQKNKRKGKENEKRYQQIS